MSKKQFEPGQKVTVKCSPDMKEKLSLDADTFTGEIISSGDEMCMVKHEATGQEIECKPEDIEAA